jgi:hypothetical protein
MAWAGSMETARTGAVSAQAASDVWRGKGPVTAWESAVQREVGDPDYGDPAAIAAQHKFTMDQAAGFEAARSANVAGQAASDAWRGKGAKIAWESAAQREVPHDYGDPAAIAAQHAFTTNQAAVFEAARVANVAGQAASDAWRGKGAKIAWESAAQKEVPHDYGDPAAIAEQHAFTTNQAAVWEAARKANIANQAASDAWRGKGAKIAWESAAQREVPHDYGDPAAIAAQHAFTTNQAAGFEASRTAAVAGQAASDVWRGKGVKIAWEPAFLQFSPNDVPHDYGDPVAIEAQHAETMAWAGKMEGSRTAKVDAQAKSDVWRSQGMKIE